jgi:hypothetical protein
MKRNTQICTLNLSDAAAPPRDRTAICPTRQRLARAFSCLQSIQLARNHQQYPLFGKSLEERIVWRELIELELQEVDEQIERFSVAAVEKPHPEPD